MPCVAKHLLNDVLSMTPGNFLALKTWKTSEKVVASTGALPVFKVAGLPGCVWLPTLTKFILSLLRHVSHASSHPCYLDSVCAHLATRQGRVSSNYAAIAEQGYSRGGSPESTLGAHT